jgi:hypothetical protein
MEDICGECLSDLDLMYVFATDGDSDFAKINWKNPGTFQLVQHGGVTFTPNEGFQGNGTTGYLDTTFICSTHAVNYTQNDASAFCATLNDVAENGTDFGVNSGPVPNTSIAFQSRNAINQLVFRVNTPTQTGGSSLSANGFWHVQRPSSTNHSCFKDGTLNVSTSAGSSGVPALSLPLLANSNIGVISTFSTRKLGCFGLGSSLAGQESDLYDVWNAYFTGL